MTTKNDITGDSIRTKIANDKYLINYDLIFRKKEPTSNNTINSKTSIRD